MVSRLIKTEEDYNLALKRIEALMDAKEGSPEADELELLSTLVEMYEERHFPMDRPDPVDAVKFRIEQMGLKPRDLIPLLGSRSKVSEVLNRKKPLSLTMMRNLHKSLGIPAEVLLQKPEAEFPVEMEGLDWSKFPLDEMARREWIPKVRDLSDRCEELIRGFIARASGFETIAGAFFRGSPSARLSAKADPYAVAAWSLRVIELGRTIPSKGNYRRGSISPAFLREITRLSYFQNGPLLAREYLQKHGIGMIVLSHLPKTYLDGAALLLPDGTPVVGLTLRYDRLDHFWFCLLHELAHIARHLGADEQIIVDDLDLRDDTHVKDGVEREADELAMESMIPKKYWDKIESTTPLNSAEVVALSEKLRIHPAIVAGRVRFERRNYKLLSNLVGHGKVRELFPEYRQDA
ncbi:MAG: ImmA/IrrE family metallo-endopeptidase [Desulfobacteraceae bacterium]|nr:MAG: ImmA/IrrE family metallo-endopeptidase [Desulfobacteraceae bacterium]